MDPIVEGMVLDLFSGICFHRDWTFVLLVLRSATTIYRSVHLYDVRSYF